MPTQLFLRPALGFIATSPAVAEPVVDAVAKRRVRETPPAAPVSFLGDTTADWALGVTDRPTWQSPAGAGVRRVEATIIGCICVFFALGLAGALGLV